MRLKSKWVILLGILGVVCGLALLAFMQISINSAAKRSAEIIAQTEKILTEKTVGATNEFSFVQMPAMHINGDDIIGVIQFESLGVSLPIGDKWEKNRISYPKRFSGSVYDNSLIVGGYYCKGQFDCLSRLDIGNRVTVTDMSGAQFSYEITDIKRKKSADADSLNGSSSHLTLFARNSKSLEYIIVSGVNVNGD